MHVQGEDVLQSVVETIAIPERHNVQKKTMKDLPGDGENDIFVDEWNRLFPPDRVNIHH